MLIMEKKINICRIKNRYIFLSGKIDIKIATNVCQSLISLETQDPGIPIIMYIMSAGGSSRAGRAIYDVMKLISSPVITLSTGFSMSAAAIILSGGELGCRFSLPNSSIMIHQPSLKISKKKTITNLMIRLKESERIKKQGIKLLAKNSKKSVKEIAKLVEKDTYLTPKKAVEIGIIDSIINNISELYLKISEKYPDT